MKATAVVLLAAITAQPIQVAHADDAPRALRFDTEADPIAYALKGHSLHLGAGRGRLRLGVGTFAAELPVALHGNEGFEYAFSGFGAKLDVFVSSELRGFFVGADASVLRASIHHMDSDRVDTQRQLNLAGRFGYRIEIGDSLYVTPWVGLGYLTGSDMEVGGDTYEHNPVSIFPTVHIGYRFPCGPR